MTSYFRQTCICPATIFASIFAASGGALFAALYSQFALGLDPCVLCLYQRMPYFAALGFSFIGFLLHKNRAAAQALISLCGIAFLINTGLALYHSGVERSWWVSAVEGCAVPDFSKDPSLFEKILTAPSAHCSVIAWSDPVFGLSMANYNVAFSLALFSGCLLALALMLYRKPSEAS